VLEDLLDWPIYLLLHIGNGREAAIDRWWN
jgi:hypothetical protein